MESGHDENDGQPENVSLMSLYEIERRSPSMVENPPSPTKSLKAFIEYQNPTDDGLESDDSRTTDWKPSLSPLSPLKSRPDPLTPPRRPSVPTPTIVELPATPNIEGVVKDVPPPGYSSAGRPPVVEKDELYSPQIARTASRTSARPRLVETRTTSSGLPLIDLHRSTHHSPPREPGPNVDKAAKVLGLENHLSNVGGPTPFVQPGEDRTVATDSSDWKRQSSAVYDGRKTPSGNNDLAAVSRTALPQTPKMKLAPDTSMVSPIVAPSSSSIIAQNQFEGGTSNPPPTSSSLLFTPVSIIEAPSTPLRRLALETLPSPAFGFGSMRGIRPVRKIQLFDALRSNPPDEDTLSCLPASRTENTRLNRSTSAPPLPFRRTDASGKAVFEDPEGYAASRSKRLNRKVTIRAADLEGRGERDYQGPGKDSALSIGLGQHGPSRRLIRENIVSTPYPTRAGSFAQDIKHIMENPNESTVTNYTERMMTGDVPEEESIAQRISPPRKWDEVARNVAHRTYEETIARDSSYSSRDEIIKLRLAIAGRPQKDIDVEIVVTDKGSFDDAQVFEFIRKDYMTLIGWAGFYLTARRLVEIKFETTSGVEVVESDNEILSHFHDPWLGHKRKTYLNFMRAHQPRDSEKCAKDVVATQPEQQSSLLTASSRNGSVTSFASSIQPERPLTTPRHPTKNMSFGVDPDANDDTDSFHYAFGTTTSRPIPPPKTPIRHPLHILKPKSVSEKPIADEAGRPPKIARTQGSNSDPSISLTLNFTHTFSLLSISFIFLLILLSSILTTVLWVLFGTPGRNAFGRPNPTGVLNVNDLNSTASAMPSAIPTATITDWPTPTAAMEDISRTGGVLVDGTVVVGEKSTDSETSAHDWGEDAGRRVTAGVLLGLGVLIGGSLLEGLWVWGSWIVI